MEKTFILFHGMKRCTFFWSKMICIHLIIIITMIIFIFSKVLLHILLEKLAYNKVTRFLTQQLQKFLERAKIFKTQGLVLTSICPYPFVS